MYREFKMDQNLVKITRLENFSSQRTNSKKIDVIVKEAGKKVQINRILV